MTPLKSYLSFVGTPPPPPSASSYNVSGNSSWFQTVGGILYHFVPSNYLPVSCQKRLRQKPKRSLKFIQLNLRQKKKRKQRCSKGHSLLRKEGPPKKCYFVPKRSITIYTFFKEFCGGFSELSEGLFFAESSFGEPSSQINQQGLTSPLAQIKSIDSNFVKFLLTNKQAMQLNFPETLTIVLRLKSLLQICTCRREPVQLPRVITRVIRSYQQWHLERTHVPLDIQTQFLLFSLSAG